MVKNVNPEEAELWLDGWDKGKLFERERIIKLLEDNDLTAASELIEEDNETNDSFF